MCGGCGGNGGHHDWYAAGVEDTPAARKRAQLRLAAWATRLFADDRIRVHEVPGTVRLVIVGPTGKRVVAQGVDGVLDAVEQVGAGRTDWSAVATRVRRADPRDDTDWEHRSLARAVDRRRDTLP